MSTSAYATVLAWQEALNSGDIDTLLELSGDGVEIADGHGGGQGLAVLDRWAEETHTTMSSRRVFAKGELVVTDTTVTGSASPGDGAESHDAGVAYRIADDRVESVFVHPDLQHAFAATGLRDGDLVED